MAMNIYIISYLGGELREKRRKMHSKQLEYFAETMPDANITVLSQCYEADDYTDGITYIDSEPVSPSIGRNILLKRFYETNDDFAVFADDDCIIDEKYYGGAKILQDFDTYDAYNYFDMVGLLHGRFTPTNALFYEDQDTYNEYNILSPCKQIKTSFCLIKNFKKHDNEEHYFDETLKELEDAEYSLRLVMLGKKVYTLNNSVSIDMGLNDSTLMNSLGKEEDFSRNDSSVYDEVIVPLKESTKKHGNKHIKIQRSYKHNTKIVLNNSNGKNRNFKVDPMFNKSITVENFKDPKHESYKAPKATAAVNILKSTNETNQHEVLNVNYVDITAIKPYGKNPRINDNAIGIVATSIKEYGWQQPIVVDKNNVIIVGHTRYAAAKSLGYTEVPVTIANHLSSTQANAYRIMDNKSNEYADWDEEYLKIELEELTDELDDILKTGYSQDEYDKLFHIEEEDTSTVLNKPFVLPPLSILDSRNNKWDNRLEEWKDFGVNTKTDPVLIEVLTQWFSKDNDKVLDTISNSSTYGEVTSLLSRQYTGTVLNADDIEHYNAAWSDLGQTDKPTPQWITTSEFNNNTSTYDLAITTLDYELPYKDRLKKTISLLGQNAFMIVVVRNYRADDNTLSNAANEVVTIAQDNNLSFHNDMIYIIKNGILDFKVGSTFKTTRIVGTTHNNILVFSKGNIDDIVDRLGNIEVPLNSEDDNT